MIAVLVGTRVWLAAGVTDMARAALPRWRREGETALGLDPYAGRTCSCSVAGRAT